jgi:uncharacterized protein YnzC (UPF0291/DUF896 family)
MKRELERLNNLLKKRKDHKFTENDYVGLKYIQILIHLDQKQK